MPTTELESLKTELARFAAERDWDQFHNPKNLAMAIAAECGELLELFQWLTPEQALHLNADAVEQTALEMADIFLFLLRMSDKIGVDLLAAARRKLELNETRYPVSKSRGRATKYHEL
jgi:dCTP diphosphatase